MDFTCLSQTRGYNLPACHIVNICGFNILFDCPLDLSALTIFSPISTDEQNLHNLLVAEPYYKTVERLHLWNVSLIDIVLISSPMGMLGLPFLTRTQGFSAKIYATEVTARLGQFMMEDLVAMHAEFKQFYGPKETRLFELLKQVPAALKEVVLGVDGAGLGSWLPLFSAGDVKECLQKVECLKYAEEACYNGSLMIKGLSSGLEMGSCNWNVKSPKRNISYISSSVCSSGTAMDFDIQPLIGSDVLIYSDFASYIEEPCSPKRTENGFDEEMEKLEFICACCIESVRAGGSVLIPIGRLGIILQLLELLSFHIESSGIKVPIFMISGVAQELVTYTGIIPEWLCKERQDKLYTGKPVFSHQELINEKKIHVFPTLHSHELLMMWQEPCIVVSPHWSLRLGPVVHLLQRWHGDPNALLVLEEGVDTDLALSPFKPIAMKVLECSFVSGIKLDKVSQLLQMLNPKLILLPDYTEPYFNPLKESLAPCLFFTENRTLGLSSSSLKNVVELNITTDLVSQLTLSKLKSSQELTVSRLKGKLLVDQGKHYLVEDKDEAFDALV